MPRILLIDDERLFRLPAAAVLRQAGHAIECAASAEEAAPLLDSFRPHLVLLDLVMPGMGGIEFLRRLRANERWASLPVVVLSAVADGNPGTTALELGVRGCLLKGTFAIAELPHFLDFAAAA